MEQLDKDKNRARSRIAKFSKQGERAIAAAEKEVIVKLERWHKKALAAVSGVTKEVQESRELTEGLTEKSVFVLQDNLVSYEVKDNSVFWFAFLRKCAGNSTLSHFFGFQAPGQQDEVLKAAVATKESLLSFCKLLSYTSHHHLIFCR